jgi:hypothetical protein
MKYILIAVLLLIIIIYTVVDRIAYLYFDNNSKFETLKNNDTIITYNNENDKFNYIPIDNSRLNINNNLNVKTTIKIKDDNVDKYYPIEKISDKEKNNDVMENNILIKYSSIRNKLDTNKDYAKFYDYIDTIRDSIYISVIENVIYDDNQLIEIIINDIQKTKLHYDFKKLKNIYIIKKINDNSTKLILFYEGLVYNAKKFKFIKNNFMGNTIVYKLDTNNNLINHYLQ